MMERSGIRAFLQRGETRLSTLHGLAGAFVGGAGLLTLFPVFFTGSVKSFISLLLADFLSAREYPAILLLTLWVAPIITAIGIPLYALSLVVRELITLYIIPHGLAEAHTVPRLALSALSIAPDEDDGVYAAVKSITYESQNMARVIPRYKDSRDRRRYVKVHRWRGQSGENDEALFRTAEWLAGAEERTLIQEASYLTTALIRVNVRLRVIVIRYVKALIAFIWTLVALAPCAAIADAGDKMLGAVSPPSPRNFFCLLFGLIWATATPYFVAWPLGWVTDSGSRDAPTGPIRNDPDLSDFEKNVFRYCFLSALFAELGLLGYVVSIFGLWRFDNLAVEVSGAVVAVIIIVCIVCNVAFYISRRRIWPPDIIEN